MPVYEICDTTDDEMYYPLGMAETLPQAVDFITNATAPDRSISEHADEHEEISVFERKFGMRYTHGKVVYSVSRTATFPDDETDDVVWVQQED